jgi:hypothetical protein
MKNDLLLQTAVRVILGMAILTGLYVGCSNRPRTLYFEGKNPVEIRQHRDTVLGDVGILVLHPEDGEFTIKMHKGGGVTFSTGDRLDSVVFFIDDDLLGHIELSESKVESFSPYEQWH